MNLNPFRPQPPTYANVIPAGEGWYRWHWLKWRRCNNWQRGCRWISAGKLDRMASEAIAVLGVGEYR